MFKHASVQAFERMIDDTVHSFKKDNQKPGIQKELYKQ